MNELRKISTPKALALLLGQQGVPVINRYELGVKAWQLYKKKSFDGIPLRNQKDRLDRIAFNRIEARLLENGVLHPVPGLSGSYAYILLGANLSDARILACAIDPFCYVSHLSAMEFHGLTDRMPEKLYISSPAVSVWWRFAEDLMQKSLDGDYFEYISEALPSLQRVSFDRLAGRSVHHFKSLHLGAFRSFKEQHFRVATLGRTFLDMVREPTLCGGISHVISVFKEHGRINKRLIMDELDQHGGPIDKVRVGWIMEDICKVSDPRIDAWTQYAQRGGSRKLDASSYYSPEFSERWALSINVPVGGE